MGWLPALLFVLHSTQLLSLDHAPETGTETASAPLQTKNSQGVSQLILGPTRLINH